MRKILICTPTYGDFPKPFVNALCAFLTKDLGAKFDFIYTNATYVEQARDELAMAAINAGFEETFWIDLDMGHRDQGVILEQTKRLLSHDVPIVCAQYTTHTVRSNFIGSAMPGAVPDANGLLKMQLAPIGWAKIKTDVFRKIRDMTPEAAYTQRNPTQEPKPLHQFFRNGLIGKNTPDGKMNRLKKYVHESLSAGVPLKDSEIVAILDDADYSDQTWMGEDFDFCNRVRAAGFDILMDTHLIIPHGTYLGLPISNADVYYMLQERWRNHDIAQLKSIIANLEFGEVK